MNSQSIKQEKSGKLIPGSPVHQTKWLEADFSKLEVVNGYHQHQVSHKKKRGPSLSIESWLFHRDPYNGSL